MWAVNGNNLKMCEGDFGIQLPIKVNGVTLTNADSLRITIKDLPNCNTILVKEFDNITNNTVNLEFTEEESALFHVGTYVYCLDWFQNGLFLCNIIPSASFKVVDKA